MDLIYDIVLKWKVKFDSEEDGNVDGSTYEYESSTTYVDEDKVCSYI